MKFELKELSENLFNVELYEMYQDIPNGDNGQTNKAYGLSFDEFSTFIKNEINRKNNKITYDDTPTITYILYVNDIPTGYICLRTKINEQWLKWSGNFYYQIRKSERRKEYATKMLSMSLDLFRKMNFKEIYGQSSSGNIGSAKTIENNGGIFLNEDNGTRYYKIIL